MAATDEQVQKFVDERIRPHAELARQLAVLFDDDIALIDDVYNALNVGSPTWSDGRTDAPPHLLTPADILSINTFLHDIRDAIKNHAQYSIVLKATVRPIGV
jgi:hypothetical protein